MTQQKTRREKEEKCSKHSDTAMTPSSLSVLMESDWILMVVSLIYTVASLIFFFFFESLSQCTSSPTRGQATLRFLFLSSICSYSAEILTTSVLGFRKGGASGLGGDGASGLARELFEGGVGILMMAVVTSPLLLQFRLPDSSDIRLRLERLRETDRKRHRSNINV